VRHKNGKYLCGGLWKRSGGEEAAGLMESLGNNHGLVDGMSGLPSGRSTSFLCRKDFYIEVEALGQMAGMLLG
jgi:hypothetical protein